MKKGHQMLAMVVPWLVGFLVSTGAQAAQDGRLDDVRSEGEIRISLAILPSLQINVVNQISVDISNVMRDAEFAEYVCITGQSGGRYQLTASGSNGDFRLQSGEGDQLAYAVFYNGRTTGAVFDELQADEPSPVYDLVASASECAQSPNFQVQFRSEDLQSVRSGLYTGALTLMVSPL